MRTESLRAWLVVAFAVAGLLFLSGCEEEDVAGVFGSPNVSATATETHELTVEPPLSLVVQTSNGEVIVRGVAGIQTASVVVRRRSRGETLDEAQDRLNRMLVHVEGDGPDLRLAYRSSEQESDVRRVSSVAFEIVAPEETRVEVETSNGAIDVTAIRGTIRLDTSNGAIDVRRSAGSLRAETSNGRVEVVGFDGDIVVDTSNGEVWLEGIVGAVDAKTSNGSVRYSGTPAEGAANRLRTSNGSITTRVPADLSIAFNVRARGGRIRSDLPLIGDTDGEDWSASLNPPATITFELRTSNGSIRLEELF